VNRGTTDIDRRERRLLAVLLLPVFCFSFQQTSMFPVLPALQRDLHTSTTWSTWTLTGFMLIATVSAPLIGRLADQFGRKRLLLATLAVFFVGSVGSALAPDVWTLIVFRGIQGPSAAFSAIAISIFTDQFRPHRVGLAVGSLATMVAVSNILGNTVSPLLTDHLSWRAMFAIPALASALTIVLVLRVVSESPNLVGSRVDGVGAALLGTAIGSLMLALTEANHWGWTSLPIVLLYTSSAVSTTLWILYELRTKAPMVDLRMLTRRTVLLANGATFLAGISTFGTLTLGPRFASFPHGLPPQVGDLAHYGFGANVTTTGLYLLPGTIFAFACGLALSRVARRTGWKWMLALSLGLSLVGGVFLALLHAEPWQLVVGLTILGFSNSATATVSAKVVIDDVRSTERAVATSLNMVSFQAGGVLGAQLVAAILTAKTVSGTSIALESAYTACFFLCAGAGALGLLLALFIRRSHESSPAFDRLPEPAVAL
jgi:MFS family permease